MSDMNDEKRLKLAYSMIRNLEQQLQESQNSLKQPGTNDHPVAVIGVACRYPDNVSGPDELWRTFVDKKNVVKEIPKTRWDIDAIYSADRTKENKTYCRKGAFFETIDEFDSLFFNISHKEAERMDPQQRLFLQGCWEAFEDAGLNDKVLNEAKCGVYAGSLNCDYTNVLNTTPHNLDLFELMGTQSSILSARISYLLNLKGPSITIDTACSSSLVAIDLAVKAIQRGDIDIALAGGVHLYVTPNLYIMMSKAQMLSEDGECKAFDNAANGFAPGEGMAVVALKRLDKALEDRDNIYGVILGGFSNQDGKTNGITAPSSLSQSMLLQEAYKRLEVNPESIGYIEAHGTGTKLGDPIEFEALSTAFRKYTDKKQFCSLGSSKTNFGHTLSAAGVTGLLKALLSLKNQKIPASLHFQKSNEHLDYLESPFFVNPEMIDWPIDGKSKRRSAVSSFGFSGTNVHLVLEEAPAMDRNQENAQPPCYLIALSAKTKTALTRKVKDLKVWLDTQSSQPNMADISLTLLRGRCHFRFRTAFVVENLTELKEALNRWQADDSIKPVDQPASPEKANDPDNQALFDSLGAFASLDAYTYHAQLQKVRQLYLEGYDLRWEKLLSKADARTISLPTYPFENEKHWIAATTSIETSSSVESITSEKRFSFVDSNESTLASQCYQKTFTGNEFYLKDHLVNLQKMLPGVAYLEMARSSGNLCNRPYKVTKIENVVWKAPIVVGEGPQTVRISLHPQQDKVAFQVFSTTNDDSKGTVHATGQLTYDLETEHKDEFLDLEALQNQLVDFVSQQQCYRIFSEKGLRYGSSFRRLLGLSYKGNRALATIEGIDDESESDSLHPGIMDAATQAVLVLVSNLDTNHQRYLPYSIESLELKNPLTRRCFSYVVRRDKTDDEDPSEMFDAILSDEDGKILLRVTGLHLVPIEGATCRSTQAAELLYFDKSWQQNAIARNVRNAAKATAQKDSPIILLGDSNAIKKNIDRALLEQNRPSIVAAFSDEYRCVDERNFTFDPSSSNDVEKLVDTFIKSGVDLKHIVAVFDSNKADTDAQIAETTTIPLLLTAFVKSLMHRHLKNEIRLVVFNRGHQHRQSLLSPITAFFKTLQLENPKFIGKAVEIRDDATNQPVTQYLLDELFSEDLSSQPIRYHEGKRLVRTLNKVDIAQYLKKPGNDEIHFDSEGVYLITGGAKGVGLAIAKHLCATVKPTLILTGRSAPNQEIQNALGELNRGYDDEHAIYLQADVSDLNDMEYVMHKIKSRWGRLNGIIHSAGINRDAFILKQDTDDLQAVLKPKIQGTLNLHQVSQSEPLDFFVLFSSIAAVFGNSGQSDYAFANAFMDDFAGFREEQRKQGQCTGKTVSINWPLWEEGGMQLDSATEKNMDDLFGMRAIDAQIGSKVIVNSLNMPFSSLLVIYGNEAKINQTLISGYVTEGNKNAIVFDQLNDAQKSKVKHESERFLKLLLSDEMKIPYEKIESSAPFENYGLDSVVYMQLNRKLEEKFGKISKTLFYEYQNIASLASYFAENHLPEIIEIAELKLDQAAPGKTPEKPIKAVEQHQPKLLPRFIESSTPAAPVYQHARTCEVAIIGLSGRYPMANDLEDFWTNLLDGKDCIEEIPQTRWDHRHYFDPQRGTVGKTYCKWGGFVDGHDRFDPLFFNISPKEAALIDPQERLFLQVAWQTIADAGYTGRSLANSTVGVYAGVMWSQYQLLGVDENYQSGGDVPESLISSVANRISYFFDFHGPSIGLDTMCSSSLTAIHLACEAIRSGECEYALAGGVNLIVHPNKYLRLAQGNFSSTDGRCRSFGIGGDGYVPGEGVGAVLLKPLDQALKDQDHIYGIIKGSQINHGGKTNGYTVPNPVLQGELIAKTLQKAGVDSQTISYVEAHGTGTALGDPIEITGLTHGFAAQDNHQFCALGSVKSNIGHLESAAGISALTKVLLQMKHKQLVPTLHCEEINPNINLETTPFYLQKSVSDWKRPIKAIDGNQREYPRRAAISSFGAGGANAHIIVEEHFGTVSPVSIDEEPRIFVFSAKDYARLTKYL
ncbi:MAG: SDR family NAD(P)-dependent oxidoreductase, partial [Gammaproteobacteria bacterium]